MGPKVVFDTNVLISALGWDAKPERCLEQVFHGSVAGYLSPALLDELRLSWSTQLVVPGEYLCSVFKYVISPRPRLR